MKMKISKKGKIILNLDKKIAGKLVKDFQYWIEYKKPKMIQHTVDKYELKVDKKLLKIIRFENCKICGKQLVQEKLLIFSEPRLKDNRILFYGVCKKCTKRFHAFLKFLEITKGKGKIKYSRTKKKRG